MLEPLNMRSPLSLNKHFVTSIQLEAIRSTDLPGEVKIEVEAALRQDVASKLTWTVDVKVGIQSSYVGHIRLYGHFSVDQNFPHDKVQEMVGINGPSILYGAAREMVANITARGPHPMISLPSVSFHPRYAGQPAAISDGKSVKKPAKRTARKTTKKTAKRSVKKVAMKRRRQKNAIASAKGPRQEDP